MLGDLRDVVVWDGVNPEGRRLSGHDETASAGVFSADGRRLFTLDGSGGGRARVIHLWDLATGGELLTIREPTVVTQWVVADGSTEPMWLEGDRLMLLSTGGVHVFDGTPRTR
jgi:hypothetical protein